MILPVRISVKCAIFPLLRPVQAQNRSGDLPQGHFRNIAHRAAQDGQGLRGVKVIDMGEILAAEIVHGVDAAPGQHDKGHAVLHQALKPCFSAEIVQFFQQAARLDTPQFRVVVAKVIFHDDLGRFQQAGGKTRAVRELAIAVLQRLDHRVLIPRLHLPDGDGAPLTAIGIGHIKDIPQLITPVRVHQQGDPPGATVDIAAMLIPEVDLGAGGGVRLLCVDQKLVTEIVLEVVGGGGQKGHVIPAVGGNFTGLLRRKLYNGVQFFRHALSLRFLIRLQQALCCRGDFRDAPGELGGGGPDL